jgi:hypothetical protein
VINKANTTAAVTSDLPDPSMVGQSFTVKFTVTPVAPGAGTPTGNVTVNGGGVNCVASVATGACSLTPTAVGSIAITATYGGDNNFNASPASAPEPHVVEYSVTLSALKTPANIGSSVPVNFLVKNAQGVVSDLSIVLKIESAFTPVPQQGGCVLSDGVRATLYLSNPNFAEGKSNLRFVGNNQGYQFNWDSTSALTSTPQNPATGKGCYTVLIYLKDRGLVNPRMSGPVQLD